MFKFSLQQQLKLIKSHCCTNWHISWLFFLLCHSALHPLTEHQIFRWTCQIRLLFIYYHLFTIRVLFPKSPGFHIKKIYSYNFFRKNDFTAKFIVFMAMLFSPPMLTFLWVKMTFPMLLLKILKYSELYIIWTLRKRKLDHLITTFSHWPNMDQFT